MDNNSLLEGVFNIIGALPQGHDKPVKHAIYNALAIFLLVVCCCAAWALFLILEPFIKPLAWAVLVGSVLHPFKYTLAQRFRFWFASMERTGTPILIGMMLIPLKVLDDVSDSLGNKIVCYWKVLLGVCSVALVGPAVYFFTPGFLISVLQNVAWMGSATMLYFIHHTTFTIFALTFVGYLSLMILTWSPKNNPIFHKASIVIWIVFAGFLANSCGSTFELPVFVLAITIFLLGFFYEVYNIYEEVNLDDLTVSIFEALSLVFKNREDYASILANISESAPKIDESKDKIEEINTLTVDPSISSTPSSSAFNELDKVTTVGVAKSPKPRSLNFTSFDESDQQTKTSIIITEKGIRLIKQPSADSNLGQSDTRIRRSFSQPANNLSVKAKIGLWKWRNKASKSLDNQTSSECSSDFYIYSVIWACVVMLFWKHVWLLPILPIPILIASVKHLGNYFGVWSLVSLFTRSLYDKVNVWCCERYDGLVPVPVRGFYHTMIKVHMLAKVTVKESIDTVSSCIVIVGLLVFLTCASVFVFIQIYSEAIMLVQMTSNVINQTVVHNPELRQLFPPTLDDTVDSILDNAYQYGREGISNLIKSVMTDVDPEKSAKLEKQVLELWDRVYQTWMSSDDTNGPQVTSVAVEHSWNAFLEDLQKSPEMFNLDGMLSFLKQNVGTLMSLLESVWTIVIGNISLVVGSFSALVSILFGGGTAVLNFILNTVIFLTTLFYLLSSSGRLYKPIELLTSFSTNSSRFGLALGGAINGVFIASFKMASFYGMWTWLIHNLFGLKIIYLPTAFAAILGAAPFLGTYWACIPGFLDLWLGQGNLMLGVLFVIFQFLPTSVVDTTIYGEIKGGGHPYLTGLAIAGGIFCLGLEGAIVGPLVLCALYVAVDLSTSLFKDSPSEESLNLQQLSRLQLQDC